MISLFTLVRVVVATASGVIYVWRGDLFFLILCLIVALGPKFVRLLFLIRAIRFMRSLDQAVLQLDGKTIKFRYQKDSIPGVTIYHNPLESPYGRRKFRAYASADPKTSFIQAIYNEDEILKQIPATLTFDEKVFHLSLNVYAERCACSRQTPCWTGKLYVGNFSEESEGIYWQGFVSHLELDRKDGLRKPRVKRSFSLPEWDLFPDFNPSPVS